MRVAAFVLAAASRIVLAVSAWRIRGVDAFLASDSASFIGLAGSLAAGRGFADGAGVVETFRTPLYPLLLAPGVAAGQTIVWALALNLIASLAIVELTFRIGTRVLPDRRIAALCAVIVAIEPTMLLWSVKVMPEAIFALSLLSFAAAFISGRPLVAVLAITAAAYVKPAAYPLLLMSIPLIAWRAAADGRRARGLAYGALVVALVAPWHARNAVQTGFAGFSTLADRALYISVGGSIEARETRRPFTAVRQERIAAAAGPAEMRRDGLARVTRQPFRYAAIHVEGMLRTLVEPGAVEYLRMFDAYPESGGALTNLVHRGIVTGLRDFAGRFPLAFWSTAVTTLALLPLAALPLVALMRRPSAGVALLLAIAAYAVIISGGPPGSSRFRAPVVPMLVLTSAFALSRTPPAPPEVH
jgi:hypothetical protein